MKKLESIKRIVLLIMVMVNAAEIIITKTIVVLTTFVNS